MWKGVILNAQSPLIGYNRKKKIREKNHTTATTPECCFSILHIFVIGDLWSWSTCCPLESNMQYWKGQHTLLNYLLVVFVKGFHIQLPGLFSAIIWHSFISQQKVLNHQVCSGTSVMSYHMQEQCIYYVMWCASVLVGHSYHCLHQQHAFFFFLYMCNVLFYFESTDSFGKDSALKVSSCMDLTGQLSRSKPGDNSVYL